MTTTEKGNLFEEKAYNIIQKALKSGKLSLIYNHCQLFQKKSYYSEARKAHIVFDIAIEVTNPGGNKPTLLYIIECKSYSDRVPVSDIEEFHKKVEQVSGLNAKGVFITDQDLQESAYNYCESQGIMWIKVNYNNNYKIILHKVHRPKLHKSNSSFESWDESIEKFLIDALNQDTVIVGLKRLSSEAIDTMTKELLKEFNPDILNYFQSIPHLDLFDFIAKEHGITFDYRNELTPDTNGNPVLGYFDIETKKIHIDIRVIGTERFPFITAHEIGHALLHRELTFNQKVYNSFRDSEYSFRLGKHQLKNDKHWVEWQANQFAASLILPETILLARLIWYQDDKGIRNKGKIYYDSQRINQIDFHNTVTFLADFFKVTKTSVIYRLQDIGVITYGIDTPKHWTEIAFS